MFSINLFCFGLPATKVTAERSTLGSQARTTNLVIDAIQYVELQSHLPRFTKRELGNRYISLQSFHGIRVFLFIIESPSPVSVDQSDLKIHLGESRPLDIGGGQWFGREAAYLPPVLGR